MSTRENHVITDRRRPRRESHPLPLSEHHRRLPNFIRDRRAPSSSHTTRRTARSHAGVPLPGLPSPTRHRPALQDSENTGRPLDTTDSEPLPRPDERILPTGSACEVRLTPLALSEFDCQLPKLHRDVRAPSSSPPPLGNPHAPPLEFLFPTCPCSPQIR